MCGICGFFGKNIPISNDVLNRMNDTLMRRGPDEGGAFLAPEVGLAMRRLSIIDLSSGHQPIHNEDNTVTVVFNGEIYNYLELRSRLQKRGHRFKTNTDTEVLVHLYEEYEERMVEHLRGMFAVALWDARRKRGLVLRDRLGIKPLFYMKTDEGLVFGSEIKAILAAGISKREIDLQALDAFFTFTYIPAPHTIYRDVRKLEPGHLLIYEHGRIEERRYWDVNFSAPDLHAGEQAWLERFGGAIESAVTSHLISDVPVGAFLSGGIDSSLVVSSMSQVLNEPVRTFTIGFGGAQNALIDERPLAKMVAGQYGCDYRDFTVNPDFREIAADIVDAFDEPFSDDSVIPTYYVSQFTRQHVKVALSGLGGDELFAGYQRYSGIKLSELYGRCIPRPLHRHVIDPLVRALPELADGGDKINHLKRFSKEVLASPAERYLGYVSTIDVDERRKLFSPEISNRIDYGATGEIITKPYERCAAPDPVSRALYVDLKTYVPEDILALSDRLSMWHSLEVRVPLVDHHLVELSAQLPIRYKINCRHKKVLLRKIASHMLPREVMQHRKQGFESPMAAWLRTDLAEYAKEILGPSRLGRSGLFNQDYVQKKLEEHQSRRSKNNKLLFSLIMFQNWYERHAS